MVHSNFVKGNDPCSAEVTSQLECLAKVMHYSICFKFLKYQYLQTTSLTVSMGEGEGGGGGGRGEFRDGESDVAQVQIPAFTPFVG